MKPSPRGTDVASSMNTGSISSLSSADHYNQQSLLADLANSTTQRARTEASANNNISSVETVNFQDALERKSSANNSSAKAEKQSPSKIFENIKKLGRQLLHNPQSKDLQEDYKSSVKDFLQQTLDSHISHKKEGFFQKVNLTNKKLDQLANEFHAKEQQPMALLKSLGELEGLLFDMLV